MYNVLLTSSYVRISELGIQWSALCSIPATNAGAGGWSAAVSCVPVQDAFCLARTSPVVAMFPTDSVEVEAGSAPPPVFGSGIICNPQTANRALVLGAAGYQVSLCDLRDGKLDFVLDVHKAQIYWRQRNEPLWWSALVTLSSLFFFTRVCEHLVMIVQGRRREFSLFTTAALGLMLILHQLLPRLHVLSRHLVTQEEQVLDIILQVYSWGHIFVQVGTVWLAGRRSVESAAWSPLIQADLVIANAAHDTFPDTKVLDFKDVRDVESTNQDNVGARRDTCTHDISTLGLLVCVQLILTAHLQSSYDNPFLGILVLLFGMRSFLKFLNFALLYTAARKSPEKTRLVGLKLVFLFVDTFTLASMLELGVRSGARSGAEYASTASGMLLVIVLGGAFLHEVIHNKCP